jgi:transcriptional accessory protein Tex/SPT6
MRTLSHRRLLSLMPRKASDFAADELFSTHRCRVGDLMADAAARARIAPDRYVGEGVGRPTLDDIFEELARPGRGPRPPFSPFSFADVHAIGDLKAGEPAVWRWVPVIPAGPASVRDG